MMVPCTQESHLLTSESINKHELVYQNGSAVYGCVCWRDQNVLQTCFAEFITSSGTHESGTFICHTEYPLNNFYWSFDLMSRGIKYSYVSTIGWNNNKTWEKSPDLSYRFVFIKFVAQTSIAIFNHSQRRLQEPLPMELDFETCLAIAILFWITKN